MPRRLLRSARRLHDWRAREPVAPRDDLVHLGSDYGGWTVAGSLLDAGSFCLSAGVGNDCTFDVELIGFAGCEVVALDPTPVGIEHGSRAAEAVPRMTMLPVGLAGTDGPRTFYPPADPSHASYSIDNLQATSGPIEADCRTLASLAAERGRRAVDLLKMDIEGSEYEVIDSILGDGPEPRQLCVEFHVRDDPEEPRRYVGRLRERGYELVRVSGWDFTFVRAEPAET